MRQQAEGQLSGEWEDAKCLSTAISISRLHGLRTAVKRLIRQVTRQLDECGFRDPSVQSSRSEPTAFRAVSFQHAVVLWGVSGPPGYPWTRFAMGLAKTVVEARRTRGRRGRRPQTGGSAPLQRGCRREGMFWRLQPVVIQRLSALESHCGETNDALLVDVPLLIAAELASGGTSGA